jgi:hypothetical protein
MADARRGRRIVIVTIVLGTLIVLGLNLLALLQGNYHPLLLLKGFVAVFWFRAIWQGNETARNWLVLLLLAVALACAFAAAVSGQLAVAAVAVPLGLACGVSGFLLMRPAVGAFMRAQRGFTLRP